MAGPAFALSSKLKTELTFKDFAEIKDHPMASKFVLTLDEIIKMTQNKDIEEIEKEKFDVADFDQEKLQALIDRGEFS